MRKTVTRSMALVLALLMLLPTTALALEDRASSRIMFCSVDLNLESSGDLDIYFTVTATANMKILGATRLLVQRYDGSSWTTEYTYIAYSTPELQSNDDSYHSTMLVYTPRFSGYYYRAVVTVYAQDSTGSSTSELTSLSQWI